MTRVTFGILSAVVLAGLAALGVIQQGAQARLRAENESLRRQNSELAQLPGENQRLSNLVAQARHSMPLSGEPSRELLRLRGEVGVLRQQNRELGSLLSSRPPEPSSSAPANGFEPSASWRDAGNTTPESAAETFSWAIKTGNRDKLAEVLVPPANPDAGGAESAAEIARGLEPLISRIEASRMVAADSPTPDETTYWFQSRLKGGETIISPLTVHRVGDQWRVKLALGGDRAGVGR